MLKYLCFFFFFFLIVFDKYLVIGSLRKGVLKLSFKYVWIKRPYTYTFVYFFVFFEENGCGRCAFWSGCVCDWIGCEVAWSMDFWVMNEHVGTTKISTQLLRIWTELREDWQNKKEKENFPSTWEFMYLENHRNHNHCYCHSTLTYWFGVGSCIVVWLNYVFI